MLVGRKQNEEFITFWGKRKPSSIPSDMKNTPEFKIRPCVYYDSPVYSFCVSGCVFACACEQNIWKGIQPINCVLVGAFFLTQGRKDLDNEKNRPVVSGSIIYWEYRTLKVPSLIVPTLTVPSLPVHVHWHYLHWQYRTSVLPLLTVPYIVSTVHWQYLHWQYRTLTAPYIDSTVHWQYLHWQYLHWQYRTLTAPHIVSTVHWQCRTHGISASTLEYRLLLFLTIGQVLY